MKGRYKTNSNRAEAMVVVCRKRKKGITIAQKEGGGGRGKIWKSRVDEEVEIPPTGSIHSASKVRRLPKITFRRPLSNILIGSSRLKIQMPESYILRVPSRMGSWHKAASFVEEFQNPIALNNGY